MAIKFVPRAPGRELERRLGRYLMRRYNQVLGGGEWYYVEGTDWTPASAPSRGMIVQCVHGEAIPRSAPPADIPQTRSYANVELLRCDLDGFDEPPAERIFFVGCCPDPWCERMYWCIVGE
jgi:hypothetical protein